MASQLRNIVAAVTLAACLALTPPAKLRGENRAPAGHARLQSSEPARPSAANCTWHLFTQTLDHFNQGVTPSHGATFKQRYCMYDAYWNKSSGPIFFYTGNESPVEVYINNTGLMWELAPKFGALIVFAEHRYEGMSIPKLQGMPDCLSYCTSAQALADYAALLTAIRRDWHAEDAPAIAFGGSYGGMLASWMRFKYPHIINGAIAGSAPIWGFPTTMTQDLLEGSSIAITRSLTPFAGSSEHCLPNLRSTFPIISAIMTEREDLADEISKALGLCSTEKDVKHLLSWMQGIWFDMAEGNFPFASDYIPVAVGPGPFDLPPWPMKVACDSLDRDFGLKFEGDVDSVNYTVSLSGVRVQVDWDQATLLSSHADLDGSMDHVVELLTAVRGALSVWYNVSHAEPCFKTKIPPSASAIPHVGESNVCTGDEPDPWQAGSWGPICCNENLNLINTVVHGAGKDLYWPPNVPRDYSVASITNSFSTASCEAGYAPLGLYGLPASSDPWSTWLTEYYGGVSIQSHSNIVFSNGLLDPWSSAGVFPRAQPEVTDSQDAQVQNITRDGSMVALTIPLGGHHLDLFFSTPNDPPCATQAREIESEHIQRWIDEFIAEREWTCRSAGGTVGRVSESS